MTSVVVVMGAVPSRAGLSGLSGEASTLQRLLQDSAHPRVAVISLGLGWEIEGLAQHVDLDDLSTPITDRVYKALGFYRLRHRLSQFPIGRLLNSMGPVDQGRVFWRLVRRSPEAINALKDADVAVAADLAGVKASWLARRRGWVASAYYDYRAAGLGVAFAIPGPRA